MRKGAFQPPSQLAYFSCFIASNQNQGNQLLSLDGGNTMYSKKNPCPVCQKMIDVRGAATHLRTQHPDYNAKKPVQSVTPDETQRQNFVNFELNRILDIYRKGFLDGMNKKAA
jgi:hypothetical protein